MIPPYSQGLMGTGELRGVRAHTRITVRRERVTRDAEGRDRPRVCEWRGQERCGA